jgi:hypothetical protein
VKELILITRSLPQKSFADRVFIHSEALNRLGISIGQQVLINSLQEEKNPIDLRNRVIATLWRSESVLKIVSIHLKKKKIFFNFFFF